MTENLHHKKGNNIKEKISEDFWVKKLKGGVYSQLYTLRSERAIEFREHILEVPEDIKEKLYAVTKGDSKNYFVLICSALAINHSFYCQDEDIIINSPNLVIGGVENARKSPLFYRLKISPDLSPAEVIEVMKKEFQLAFEYRNYNYDTFRDRAADSFDMQALGQVGLRIPGLTSADPDYNVSEIQFHYQMEDSILSINYDASKFEAELIGRYGKHFLNVIRAILFARDTRIASLFLPEQGQQKELLQTFNNTFVSINEEATVVHLFEAACSAYPHHVAIQTPDVSLTYKELNSLTDALADYLLAKYELAPETVVGVMVDRSEWIIVSILGILKAGFAFLPIDPDYPVNRIRFLIGDSESPLIISESKYLPLLEGFTALDILEAPLNPNPAKVNKAVSHGLAYMIYTSGSTGLPKGVLVEHTGLTNHVNWFSRCFAVKDTDSSILVSSYSWDGNYSIIWSCLVNGGKLHILPNDQIVDTSFLLDYISRYSVTYLKLVPSFFSALIASDIFRNAISSWSLRLIVLGGEPINISHLKKYLTKYPTTLFANHYGPTEATIGATTQIIGIENLAEFSRLPVIGSPYDNCEIYILDKNRNLLPVGVTGELYIGGRGVARGYWNRRELNQEKFLNNPFKEKGRLYRTGDFGFWTNDGKIVFKGRSDFQVKIRGYRIELGEIESVLMQLDYIENAVVLVNLVDEDVKELTAFICSFEIPALERIRTDMSMLLPDFMVPNKFVLVESIPVNINGKTDQERLLALPGRVLGTFSGYLAPRNKVESELIEVLGEVLRNERIGLQDDFFALGGDSIKSIQVVSRLRQRGYQLQ
ncbi:amino acid adenylation domain-containing protein, partial [Mucilaginibacter sp. SG538B]|uniref:non-ribosomal peptide synthetase n=1 Tax=Mucilaginibacter sp. SG538B TaxID=2587021 RepID=UPI00159DD7E4